MSVAVAFAGAPAAGAADEAPTPEQRAAALVARMTLDEKITELHGEQNADHQRYVPGVPRLGIPPLVVTNGPAGAGPGDDPVQQAATALPAPISLAASFDTSLAHQYGVVTGAESADLGENVLEGPDVNIARVPVNGRTFEGYGEDPYLDGQLAASDIQGIQSQGVIAEVKHFAANNQETNRGSINEIIDDRTMHEIYLPQFEASVKQGHAGAVMCAYNRVNGPYACENDELLQNVLRGQWGFDGFVQSDFGATHSTVPSALAGMDLEMPTGVYYDTAMKQAVADGQISQSSIDTLLVDRLSEMIRLGLFDHLVAISPLPIAADGVFAREAAEQGTVLLKNSGPQLPLEASGLHSIAVVGPYAGAAKTGGGGSSQVKPAYTVDPVDGIRDRVGAGVSVGYDSGADPAAAAALAAKSDVAVVMVGDDETEGQDKAGMALTGDQDQLVEAVAAANPHTVVVVKSGSPVLMPWVDKVAAVMEAWYPGEEDGNAVAAVLFGDVDPSGKLPVTFPRAAGDVPAHTPQQYPGVDGTAVYSEGLDVGYRWYDTKGIAPLFPFGFGLSYTTFAFSRLTAAPTLSPGGHVTVGVDVTNTGTRTGAEVAQVYVTDPSSAGEPPKQLKGFAKVSLAPGQTRHVSATLDERAFSTWESAAQGWATHDGRYTVSVGDSSRDLPLSTHVVVPVSYGAQGVGVSAPAVAAPGTTTSATTTFTNTGDLPVRQVRTDLHAPAGWSARATGRASFPVVAPHRTVRTTWRVAVPPGTAPGSQALKATAAYRAAAPGSSTAYADTTVPFPSLASAYDNRGVSDDGDPSAAAFTTSGRSYSAQALAASGVRPGPLTHAGTRFTWPVAAAGQPDDVEANGQAVALTGAGTELCFLGASASGTHGGTGTVYYTDGSTQDYSLSFSDWWNPASTDDVVARAPYTNTPTGRADQTAAVYYASVPLAPDKTVRAITLPTTGATPGPGLHIFAMAIH